MVNNNKHEITVGISRIGDELIVKMKILGWLKHSDYELMVPVFEEMIAKTSKPQVKVLVDATEFEGWELRAAWDDFKFGLKFNNEIEKIAFVGNKKWEEYAIKLSNIFMHPEMKYFEQMDEAILWISK